MKETMVSLCVMVLIHLVLVMTFSRDCSARKATRPVMGADNTISSWQEVEIRDERAPMGVDERPDAVGVFGYPNELIGLNIGPSEAGVDTTKPLRCLSIICAKGDELPESGPWDARCYVQFHTSYQGMETKPLKDWAGECQINLVDKKGKTRSRKMVLYRKPFYGEYGTRYKNMVYYYPR